MHDIGNEMILNHSLDVPRMMVSTSLALLTFLCFQKIAIVYLFRARGANCCVKIFVENEEHSVNNDNLFIDHFQKDGPSASTYTIRSVGSKER